MSRFAPLPSQRKGTATELINWGDPGDYRNRGAVTPRSSSKRLQAFYDGQEIPSASAQSPKVVAPATAKVSAAAPAAPTKPKSAATIAAEAANTRIVAVMDSPASAGKKKAATALLLNSKASASEIIAQLKNLQPDAVREQAEVEEMWKKATAKANALAGFNDQPVKTETAPANGWAKAIAKVNAMNGYAA